MMKSATVYLTTNNSAICHMNYFNIFMRIFIL